MGAIEQFNSRGGSSGNGNWNRVRKFHVVGDPSIPIEFFDPLADSELPERGSGYAQFPGVVVTGYTPTARITLRGWFVDVHYGVPTTLTPTWGGQWQVSVSGSSETVKQDTTTLDPQQIEDGVVAEIVGQPYYEERVSSSDGEFDPTVYTTKTRIYRNGEIVGSEKNLRRLDLRKRAGMQVNKPVGMLTLQRRFTRNINYSVVLSQLEMVNTDVFYGAARGQLRFKSLNVNPVRVHIVENPTGVGEVVSLNFQWRTEGHQHKILHQYEDPDDSTIVSPVLRDKKTIIEAFSTYLETSFSAMLNEL